METQGEYSKQSRRQREENIVWIFIFKYEFKVTKRKNKYKIHNKSIYKVNASSWDYQFMNINITQNQG